MLKSVWNAVSQRQPAASLGVARASVIVPLYNHQRYIAQALHSALEQGPILREVIVVDDGSTDDSVAALRDACRQDPKVVFWTQPNRGAHAALNAGLMRATGDVLFILNSDDVYAPGRLDQMVAALDSDATADLVASGLSFIDDEGSPISSAWYEGALTFYRTSGDLGTALVNGNFVMTTSNFAFRRELIEKVGLFAPLRYTHDLDYLLRSLAQGCRVKLLLDQPLLSYRQHARNTIKEDHGSVRVEWAIAAAAYLDCLIAAAGPSNWTRLQALNTVLDRHELLPAVVLCLSYLRQQPSGGTMRYAALLADTGFRAAVMEAL